jgi:hypothetical protein
VALWNRRIGRVRAGGILLYVHREWLVAARNEQNGIVFDEAMVVIVAAQGQTKKSPVKGLLVNMSRCVTRSALY